jgi:excisionase family DNA binding protein
MADTMREESRLLTVEEAGQLLGIGRSSVYKLIKAGHLQPVPLRGLQVTRLRRSDVLALIGEDDDD